MRARRKSLAMAIGLVTLGADAALAQQTEPLSAIDWLRQSAVVPQTGGYPVTPPAVAANGGESIGAISVRALDALQPEAIGLFPASRVGLPAQIWGPTPANVLSDLIRDLPADMLPALRDQTMDLLLAEFGAPLAPLAPLSPLARSPAAVDTPSPSAGSGFLLSRIDKLVDFGALDQAAALLDALDPSDPQLRLRRFDIGLLLGDEYRACRAILRPDPPIADQAALVFCLARDGQWQKAQDTLAAAESAGRIEPYEAELLGHFLGANDGLPGASTLLPPPVGVPTPLVWRLLEASGDPVSTLALPVAFAHADLRGTIGWRAQLEAAERLVRAGALSPNRLLGLYTERRPAASGGIWERVRAIQALDEAVKADDARAAGRALLAAWPLVQAAELEVAVAQLYAPALRQMALPGAARDLAFRMGLLTEEYETVALALTDPDPADTALDGGALAEDRFLAAIARGLDPARAGAMPGELASAVAQAFAPAPTLPDGFSQALSDGRIGEEILRLMILLGGPGDPRALAEGLAGLRAMGLEDTARRTALQSLLLERRG